MKVIVRGRQGGKTTEIINWLLDGSTIEDYPGWSRVIVCFDNKEVIRVTKLVWKETKDWPNTQSTFDVRKCVWSKEDLPGRRRALDHLIEYGIDNLDMYLGLTPTIVTMTGELDDRPSTV